MPVDSPHPLYALRAPQWKRCRDAKGGQDAIKAAGLAYLPALDEMDHTQYAAYVQRAMFYDATERTVEGLTGLVLRKAPTVELPDLVDRDLDDLTLSGQSWESLLLEVLDETITTGRVGLLVEFAVDNGTRPYWTTYQAEAILNWRTGSVPTPDGMVRTGLTRVVLREEVEASNPTDPFQVKTVLRYRVLEIVEGRYTVTVWRKATIPEEAQAAGGQQGWLAEAPIVPLRRNKPLTAIPFIFIGARHSRPTPDKPPLLAMVDVNLSHYRSSADLEHGRHYTALPTPWITGQVPGTIDMKIGSGVAWTLADPQARVGMLEFTGQGLAALEKALEHKERLMAILGARLLEGQPMRGETAEAVRLRHAGDSATLASIVCSIDEGLTMACRWHAWWQGDDGAFQESAPIEVTLNRDFFEQPMDAPTANTALTMWQANGISWETYFWLLQKGEWMRPNVTMEEERALVKAQAAIAMAEAQEPMEAQAAAKPEPDEEEPFS